MSDIYCPRCRLQQPTTHTYCASCGTSLPIDLVTPKTKSARFFAGIRVAESDPEHGYLRVTHHRSTQRLETEATVLDVPSRHIRFSMWTGDEARCVISLPISEAIELCDFLQSELHGSNGPLTAQIH